MKATEKNQKVKSQIFKGLWYRLEVDQLLAIQEALESQGKSTPTRKRPDKTVTRLRKRRARREEDIQTHAHSTHTAAHNCLKLQFQGIQYLPLTLAGTRHAQGGAQTSMQQNTHKCTKEQHSILTSIEGQFLPCCME